MLIPFTSYTIIDNLFHLQTDTNTIVFENVGYWKDKPVLSYNNNKYVLLEDSKNIVEFDNLGVSEDSISPHIIDLKNKEEQISKNLLKSINNIITTNKSFVNQKQSSVVNNSKFVKNDINLMDSQIDYSYKTRENNNPALVENINLNILQKSAKRQAPSQQEIVKSIEEITPKKTNDNNSVISGYLNILKKNDHEVKKEDRPVSDTINYVNNGKQKTLEEELLSILDTKKDDPRIKRLFSHYTEQTKKEVHEINDKYSKQYLAKLVENSGGGGGTVNYAKGGDIDGNLTITSNLSVMGTVYGNLDNKRVFIIGNNVDVDYIIEHNLNTKDLVVSLYDEDDEIVLGSIKNINSNQTLVKFSSPVQNIKVVIIR